MKKLFIFLLLALPALGQTFAGRSGGDIFILPPYRFCLGEDNGQSVCLIQNGNQAANVTGSLDFKITPKTVATLPAATVLNAGRIYRVTDGASSSDCTSGGGTTSAICVSNGVAWTGIGGGGVPGGSPSQVQFNNSGAFGGVTGVTASGGAITVGTGGSIATSGSGTVAATSAPFAGVGAGTNANALVTGPGGSHTPSGTGQISGTPWLPEASGFAVPSVPTVSVANTGGNLTQGIYYIRLTYVGLGTTVPSGEIRVQLNAANCASNTTCQITVNMPTSCQAGNLPSGVTGCTVWDFNALNAEKQQAAANACVNITTATCLINTLAAGSTLTAPASSGVVPGTITAIAQPDLIVPNTYGQIADGTWVPVAGMDYSALNVLTGVENAGWSAPQTGSVPGTFTWTHRFFFNDTNAAPIQANNFVSIHHLACQTTGCLTTPGTQGVDDRGFGVEMVDAGAPSVNVEQSLSQYNERIVANNNFNCSPIGNPSATGESCFAAGRFITSDLRSAPAFTLVNNEALVGVANVGSTATGLYASCIPCVMGVRGGVQEIVAANLQGAFVAGVLGAVNGAAANTNGSGYALWAAAPSTRFATQNGGLFIAGGFSNAADFGIRSDATALSRFQGPIMLPSIKNDVGTINVTGSFNTNGETTTQLATPSINSISNGGTPGATSYTYKAVARDAAGGTSVVSAGTTTSTGNATLSGSNFNTINFSTASTQGPSFLDIYRTACGGASALCTGGNAVGKIGTFTITDSSGGGFIAQTFNDTGLNGDNTVGPTVNTSGGIAPAAGAVSHFAGNLLQVASNFTTAANTNLQTITGLVFNVPGAVATNYSFHCSLAYSQATANVAVAFGIQAAAVAPTNIFASGTQQITVGPPGTSVSGVLPTLTTTTATNIVSGTPGATATNYVAQLDGTLEMPSATNQVNFMVSTAAAGDAVTVLRGSYCQIL